MGIVDLFRPKYRHSNAEVRVEAVRELGPDEADLLVKLAREDREPSVRRIALEKIDDPDTLVELARGESERALIELAEARAASIWVSQAVAAAEPDEAQRAIDRLAKLDDQRALAEVASRAELAGARDAALAEVDDDRALAELARSPSTHMAARATALERISDPEVLRSIAVDETRKDLALAALDRVDDEAALEAIAAKAKNKSVRTRARKKLAELQTPEGASDAAAQGASPEDKRRHAERVQLARVAEKLARGDGDWVKSAERMAEVKRDWEALGAPDSDDSGLVTRFDKAVTRFERRYQAFEQAAARKARAAGPEARPEATEAHPDAAGAGEADTEAKSEAKPEANPEAAGAGEQGEGPGEGEERAAQPEGEGADRAGEAGEGASEEDARRKKEREQKQRERRERDLATLKGLTQELQTMAESGQKRRTAERLLQRADKSFGSFKLPDSSDQEVARFHEARQALFIRVQELREAEDWARWANVPRQEALIDKAKVLLADPDKSNLAQRLKSLQSEWKEAGPVPQKKSQELWNEFKTVCDQIYEQVKAQRARAAEEQVANLRRKEALCERAEALSESTDWDTTADELKGLQREWKAIGPVPRKKADAIWKRFRAACDHFFERRKPYLEELLAEREKNLEAKQALCERAEELSGSTDWKETSLALRDLQREWKAVGPVPRKDAAEINKRFRAACDRFFERRKQHREEEKAARQRKIEELGAEIAALESEVASPEHDPADVARRALEVRAAVRDLELDGKDKKELLTAANALYRSILEAHGDAFQGTELDPEASRQKKDKLLAKIEQMAPPPRAAPEPEEQTPEQVAERLRAALAERALSASLAKSTDGRSTVDAVTDLRDSWLQVGPVPGAEGDELEERFYSACERALRTAGMEPEDVMKD